MKVVTKLGFQGDVMFRKRGEPIPREAAACRAGTEVVVAHSETGHHHVAEGAGLQYYPALAANPMLAFLRVPGTADVVHRRAYDTHETVRLDAGDWDVVRQREWAPEGWRRVED